MAKRSFYLSRGSRAAATGSSPLLTMSPWTGRQGSGDVRSGWLWLLAIVAIVIAGGARAGPVGAAACQPISVGVDTSRATNSALALHGEALGQTFLASDTLIRSITVWRVASQDTSFFGMRLYVTENDSMGEPDRCAIVQDGPTLLVPYGDGTHHIKVQFSFDPPLCLPHRGFFYFAVQPDPCFGYFDMPTDSFNGYPNGRLRTASRSDCEGCLGGIRSTTNPNADLIFTIEFCDSSTPVIQNTWGRVKVLYR